MQDPEIRAALDRHWATSDANDFEGGTPDLPRGRRARISAIWASAFARRRNIQSARAAQPNRKRFTVRQIVGAGDLWVTEYVLTYDDRPSYTVSIMEFVGGQVARETQYFGDPFEPGPSRAQWVEPTRDVKSLVKMIREEAVSREVIIHQTQDQGVETVRPGAAGRVTS